MTSRHRLAFAALVAALALARVAGAARTVVTTIPAGITPAHAVAASNGSFVLVASGSSGSVTIVDGRSFTLATTKLVLSSGGTGVRSLAAGSSTAPKVAAGTGNGKVEQWSLASVVAAANGSPVPSPTVFAIPSVTPAVTPGAISGVALNAAGTRLYAADQTHKSVTAFDDSTGLAVSGQIALGHTPLNAAYVNNGFLERVFFGTDDGNLAWVDAGTLTPAVLSLDNTQTHDLAALAVGTFPGPLLRLVVLDVTSNTLLLMDPAGPSIVQSLSLLSHPVAVAISGPAASARIWVAEDSSTGGANQVECFDGTLAVAQPAVPLAAAPVSLVEGSGYLWAGLASGGLAVLTDRPFLDITAVSPNPVAARGTDVSVTFTSTESGTSTISVNGGVVASGTTVTAGTPATIVIPGSALGDSTLLEGRNRLRVEVSGSTSALVGHDETALTLDVPPPTPSGFRVGFGDGRVIASWDALSGTVTDFKEYVVRFGTAAGGTGGIPGFSSPRTTTSTTYAVDVSNGTTVFMSVLSKDSAGNLSAASPVLSSTAQPTSGAADLAGDKGGFLISCRVGPLGAGARGLASVLGAGIAMLGLRGFFRRRNSRYSRDMGSFE